MKVKKTGDSTKENINNTPKENVTSSSNPAKIFILSKKIMSKWPVDDLLQLVNRMKGTLSKNNSNPKNKFSVQSQIKTIVWNNIAFNDHPGNDCSSVWSAIQRRICMNRILKEVLADAKQAVSKTPRRSIKKRKIRHPEEPKRPLSAYLIFCSENRKKVYQENPGIKNTDVIKLLAKMFNSLSEDDRKIYKTREEELKQIYKEQINQFHIKYPNQVKRKTPSPTTNKPPTPFQIYHERQIKSVSTSSESATVLKKRCRQNWKNMNKDEKIVFINLAVENERKFYKELEDLVEKPKYKSVLSKEERLLSDKQAGKPTKPPHSAYGLFTQVELKKDEMKQFSIKERMKLVGTRWNNCSQEKKAKYISETFDLKEKYKSEYDSYLRSLPEEQRQEELKTKSKKRKLLPKDNQIKKKRKIESPKQNNLVRPKQPQSAPELFAQTHCDKNINFEQAWVNLTQMEKRKYTRKVGRLHKKYLVDFEAYAKATLKKKHGKTKITGTTSSKKVEKTSISSSSKESVSDNLNNENENKDRNSEDSSSNSSNSGSDSSDDTN